MFYFPPHHQFVQIAFFCYSDLCIHFVFAALTHPYDPMVVLVSSSFLSAPSERNNLKDDLEEE